MRHVDTLHLHSRSQDSFKDLANVLRCKILERYEHDARVRPVQKDLIKGMESLIKVVRLGWKSWAIPRLCIFCILWVSRPFKADLVLKSDTRDLRALA